jgi:CAAX prenyl protease-like protein
MWTLEQPWAPRRDPVLAETPFTLIATLGASWLTVGWLVSVGWLPSGALWIAEITAAHGGLLAVALAWGIADGGVRLPPRAELVPIALIGAGATAATLDERAAIALVGAPAWLAILAYRGQLEGLGLGSGIPLRPLVVGGAIGAFLGGHLLFSASQTLGYPLRGGGWPPLLVLWAYDVGARVISAECFFRGALFNRLQRRWSFGPAAALATALSVARYLVDPLMPGQVEAMVGALFYLTILGAVNCWLLWWSGSLVPGLLASALFFFAYRALAIG